MVKKYIAYAFIPVMALAFMGVGTVSAHGLGWGMGMWHGMGHYLDTDLLVKMHQAMFEDHAKILGITIDEAKNAWAQGKTLEQLAKEKGIKPEQLKQKIAEIQKQRLQAQLKTLVDKGIITQAQADQRLKFLESKPPKGKMMGFGRGNHFKW